MRIHYLQHVPFENPGSILTWAEENNCFVSSTKLYQNDSLPGQKDFDWLVIMGGPMNIYEEKNYHWLTEEKIFIKESIAAGKIVIGLCLGGQLLADAIGGKVTANPCKEIGWFPIRLSGEWSARYCQATPATIMLSTELYRGQVMDGYSHSR